jgi:peptidoglycan/xylan/chitin deacetylase (PgdA/CDA1 family)
MSSPQIVFLMYHELELPGRPLCQADPGYVRYILPRETFAEQMTWLKQQGFRGLSVSQSLAFSGEPSVALTFDDGSETDLIAAAPVLQQANFGATFYVTASFVEKPGYLSVAQLRELQKSGFEIGCHSMTHPYLSDIASGQLETEIAGAKHKLEEWIGEPVHHFSCPGGRYDERTLATARRAGYLTVANSRYHANSASTDRFQLGRVALFRGMDVETFGNICRGRGLWQKRASDAARRATRRVFGNSAYDRLRAAILSPRNR